MKSRRRKKEGKKAAESTHTTISIIGLVQGLNRRILFYLRCSLYGKEEFNGTDTDIERFIEQAPAEEQVEVIVNRTPRADVIPSNASPFASHPPINEASSTASQDQSEEDSGTE